MHKFILNLNIYDMKYKIGVKLEKGIDESVLKDAKNALQKVESDHGCVFEFYRYGEDLKTEIAPKTNTELLNRKQDDWLFSFGG
jgi:hypothetical protein